jgi:cytosine/adenosine deaminase-related metal-dependent hydrolase
MTTQRQRVLASRWIIPASGAPINGGWLRIQGGRIVELGRGEAPRDADDLGDVALLPGLINAHTHLEFSDCAAPIGQTGVGLWDWVGQVVAARSRTTPQAKQAAIGAGWRELREAGTSLACEISTPPSDYPRDAGLPELMTFAEVLGLSAERSGERLEAAARHCTSQPHGGVSPHAPYSTSLDAIASCIALCRRHGRALAMHVAESPAERELLCSGGGPLAEMLRKLGAWREGQFPWGRDPFVTLIDRLAAAPRVLLIHGNDLQPQEIDRLAAHRNVSLVFCPRTHHFFGHYRHPVDRLLAAGVRVALGTDSRASNPDLDLWREVQFLLRHRPDLPPREILQMATIHGAEAVGRTDLGRIEVGSSSQLGFVPTGATSEEQLYADLAEGQYEPISPC